MPLANKNMSKFPLLQSHEDSIELAADAEPSEGEKEEREEEVCCASALTLMCLGEHVTHAMCTKQTNRPVSYKYGLPVLFPGGCFRRGVCSGVENCSCHLGTATA